MNKFFENLNNSLIMQIAFFVMIMTFLFIWFSFEMERFDLQEKEDFTIAREIESVNSTEDKLQIFGWVLRHKSVNKDVQIMLKSVEGFKVYLLDTLCQSDQIVNEYFSENWNYGDVRFQAEIDKNKLKDNVCYEIMVVLRYNTEFGEDRITIETGRYLYNQKLYSYNPNIFVTPQIQDEFINKVIKNGELCLYDEKEMVYVYKYEDKFYWIVGQNFRFDENGRTYISYQMWTTMLEKLPEHRQIYEFEHWDFYFEDNEYMLTEESLYRVAVNYVQTNFPVTHYLTGRFDLLEGKFIWKSGIYPFYDLQGE